jgi:hypothetical protein
VRKVTIFLGKVIKSRASTEQAAPPPGAKATAKPVSADWDVSESFRRARTALSEVSKDLEALRRRARSLAPSGAAPGVKSAERAVK